MSNLIEELTAHKTISQYPSGRAMLTDAIRLNHLAADYIKQLEQRLLEVQKLAATNELRAIGELLRTQDNQCTADAIFVVERKCIVTGFDTDYCESDQIAWCIEDSMHFKGEDYFKELEDEFIKTGVVREDHTRTGFIVYWDFVQLFFTQSAADELISKHGHKYDGELRVSVESAYRNKEFQTVRNWLMSLPKVDAVIKDSRKIAQEDCEEKPCSFCFSRDCNGTCISGLDN